MARNAIESDFQSSKMAAGGGGGSILLKKKNCVLIWNGEKCDQKWFSVIQNGHRRPFYEKKLKQIKAAYWFEKTWND